MSKHSLTFFDKLQVYLFDDNHDLPADKMFSEHELEMRRRYQAVFTYWLDKPTLSDKKIIQFMTTSLGLSKPQAYRDMANIKILLGNVRNAAKEWQRYKLIAMLDKAYELAEIRKNPMAMIQAADKLGKYTNLDKEDSQHIPYDEIVPQSFEPTGDVSVLGIEPIPNLRERQQRLREKYGSTLIEDATYDEPVDDEEPAE